MSGGWRLPVDGGFSRNYSWKTYKRPFFLAAWLSHSMGARCQQQVSQENQVEVVLHFIHWSWKSFNNISTIFKSLPRYKESRHKPLLSVERCQCHLKGRAYRMVSIGTVIFGKYKLLQSWKGRSFRIAFLESRAVLYKECSKDHLSQ